MPRNQEEAYRLTDEQKELAASCYRLACRYALKSSMAKIDRDEAISVAMRALCKAASNFDPARGVKFSTYAARYIFGALLGKRQRTADKAERRGPHVSINVLADKGREPGFTEEQGETPKDELRTYLAKLSEEDRDLLTRWYIAGERLVDIGRSLGISRPRVHQKMQRAIQRVREANGL